MARLFFSLLVLGGCVDKGGDAPPADDGSSTTADDTAAPVSWHPDADGDGFGDPNQAVTAVDSATSYVEDGSDCDDTDSAIHPGAEEACNHQDDDCDGDVDEDLPGSTWYTDSDDDGFGDPTSAETSCAASEGEVVDGSDCDDTDSTIFPGADETCGDTVDRDCDGAIARCPVEGDLQLANAGVALWGPIEYQTASTVAIGDLNGDGQMDLVVGAPTVPWSPGVDFTYGEGGAIYVQDGPITDSAVLGAAGNVVTEVGSDRSYLGNSLAVVEDLNGDGFDEISAFRMVDGESSVALWLGPIEGVVSADDWDARLTRFDMLLPFFPAGDHNSDGIEDLVVSLGQDYVVGGGNGYAGMEAILAGPLSGTIDIESATIAQIGMASGHWSDTESGLGADVDSADLNGDGIFDLCLGQTNPGASSSHVYFLYGPVTGTTYLSYGTVSGEEDGMLVSSSSHIGWGVQCDDINEDGYPDVLTGAGTDRTQHWLGGAWIEYGPLTGAVSTDDLGDGAVLAEGDWGLVASPDIKSDIDGDDILDLTIPTVQETLLHEC